MKDAKEVGKDFDRYAEEWKQKPYGLEIGGGKDGVRRIESDEVKRPGDEWGAQQKLLDLYKKLFDRYLAGGGEVSFLEIGPGGGRATECVLQLLGDRVNKYVALDVSAGFVDVLRERVGARVEVVVLDDVNLKGLPRETFDFCIAQSSWSHINLYDQYRYLRELRRVMKPGAPIVVIGQFLVGTGNEWMFNRFRRRVDQIDRRIHGVYHEFVGISTLAEFLVRLDYEIDVIFNSGFVARRGAAGGDAVKIDLDAAIEFPYVEGLGGYLDGVAPTIYRLPLSRAGKTV